MSGKWMLLFSFLAALLGVALIRYMAISHPRDVSIKSLWAPAQISEIKWVNSSRGGRSPGMLWRVSYSYSVQGVNYRGHNISPGRNHVGIPYGRFPVNIFARLNEIQSCWYEIGDPAKSALFIASDKEIITQIADAYVELSIQAQRDGKFY